jgi:rhodanese-related sulfurtransferase
MVATSTLKSLSLEVADAAVDEGAAFVDLRPIRDYLDVHIPGSLALLYEFGPGMASRARDCLPLSLPLVLLDDGGSDLMNAAASLRGKGFTVLGRLEGDVSEWAKVHGTPASTEVVDAPAEGATVLDVSDPGAPETTGAVTISIERLWTRVHELEGKGPVVICASHGIRAALAVGMLERAGIEVVFWWSRGTPTPSR